MIRAMKVFMFILLCFVCGLTYYKFNLYSPNNNYEEVHNYIELGKTQSFTYDVDYLNLYKEHIINDIVLNQEYFIATEDSAIYGKIVIDSNKKLFIVDEKNNKTKTIKSDKTFKTMYNTIAEGKSGINFYAITEDGKAYLISLYDTNIEKVYIKELNIKGNVEGFVYMVLKNYLDVYSGKSIVLYTKEGKMYDAISGVEYSEKIYNVFDKYIIYSDNTISNIDGKMLVNKQNNNYKVKSILVPFSTSELIFDEFVNVFIITEDNKIVYLTDTDLVYEHPYKVKSISNKDTKITIVLSNDSKIEFEGTFDENNFSIK